MKFQDFLIKHQIQEWKNYYISFEPLNKLLKSLRLLKKRLNFKEGNQKVHNFTEIEQKFISDVDHHFLRALHDQLLKIQSFLNYKVNFYMGPLLIKFVFNVSNFKQQILSEEERDTIGISLREELEKYYKEVYLVKQYMSLNFRIYERLCMRYRTEFERLNLFNPNNLEEINKSFQNARIDSAFKKMDCYLKVVGTMHQENFYSNKDCKVAAKRLKLITSKDGFSSNESFYFGFFIGTFCVCILLIATLLIETRFFDEQGSDFVTYMFPIFRGTLMCFLYWFLLGVDVYVWDRYNINYKRVFDMQKSVTSSSYQIMKRAFGFLSIWVLVFSYCALSNTQFFDSAFIFNKITSMHIAPIVWMVFFLYMLFPSTKVFNYEGRLMFWQQLGDLIKAPFSRISYRTGWSMTQFLSFLIVLKDFMYTVCYVDNVYDVGTIKNNCFDANYKLREFLVIFVIVFWKNLIGVNKFYFLHKDRAKYTEAEFKAKRFGGIRGMTKGLIMTVVAIISFNLKNWPELWYYWFVATCILTVWSYRDDIMDDWGFMQTKDLLREKLSYPHKRFYYCAIVLNLVLRLAWVIGLSPAVLTTTLTKNVVGLILIILESLRCTVWNFFKIENEHLKYQGNFSFINSYDFPYDFEIDMSNPETRVAVATQVRILLKNAFVRRDIYNKNYETDLNVSMLEPSNKEGETARVTRLSELVKQTYKPEKEHQTELYKLNNSVQSCIDFTSKIDHTKLGVGQSRLGAEHFANFLGRITNVRPTENVKKIDKDKLTSLEANKGGVVVIDFKRDLEKALVNKKV